MPWKSRPVKITPKQRAYLMAVARDDQSKDVEKCRALIVLLLAEGFKNKDIARLMKVHENTVVKWRRRWAGDNEGATITKGELSGGRPRRLLTPCVLDKIRNTANEIPPNGKTRWTVKLMAQQFNMSIETMQRALVELNIDLKVARSNEIKNTPEE